ncbi:MAG: IS630 family transposase [Acidimicrobiales bacterium]
MNLRRGDRDMLESWIRSGTIEARLAKRARIVLMAADGATNRDIADVVGLHYNQVGLWRKRYSELGLAGLADEERRGRPCVYDHDDVLLLVKTVTEEPPDGVTRWTMEALAEAMASHGVPISASQCWRICKALDLKPWQVESWMTSHDPDFWEKAADVCGLYLHPPENAIVWSVDEKTSIQAKARINPSKPAVPGFPERREFEYERNGTVVLFAGLNVHEGDVAGWVTDSTCSDNFVTFLWDLMDQTPQGMDLHCICDNLAAHQTDQVAELLQYNPRVHLHFTPTHASWLNQVELFFSILERRLLRRGEFGSVEDLTARIIAFIKDYNRRAAPFRWTYEGRPLKAA